MKSGLTDYLKMRLSMLLIISRGPKTIRESQAPIIALPGEGLIWEVYSIILYLGVLFIVGYCANGRGTEQAFLNDCERWYSVDTSFSGPVLLKWSQTNILIAGCQCASWSPGSFLWFCKSDDFYLYHNSIMKDRVPARSGVLIPVTILIWSAIVLT